MRAPELAEPRVGDDAAEQRREVHEHRERVVVHLHAHHLRNTHTHSNGTAHCSLLTTVYNRTVVC